MRLNESWTHAVQTEQLNKRCRAIRLPHYNIGHMPQGMLYHMQNLVDMSSDSLASTALPWLQCCHKLAVRARTKKSAAETLLVKFSCLTELPLSMLHAGKLSSWSCNATLLLSSKQCTMLLWVCGRLCVRVWPPLWYKQTPPAGSCGSPSGLHSSASSSCSVYPSRQVLLIVSVMVQQHAYMQALLHEAVQQHCS